MGDLTNGMYIAAIENEHGFVNDKIIKQWPINGD